MEATRNSPALILQRRPYRESDALVTAYTLNFGKLALVARGAKKLQSKLAGHLEPLTRADLMIIAGRGFDYVGAAASADSYPGIRRDLNKLYYAGRALHLFDRLVHESAPDRRLFFQLSDWLETLDRDQTDSFSRDRGELFFSVFALRLLGELGYQPQTDKCLDCGQPLAPGRNYFHLLHGGLISGECFDKRKETGDAKATDLLLVSDNCVKILRLIARGEPDLVIRIKADSKLVRELSGLVDGFIKFRS